MQNMEQNQTKTKIKTCENNNTMNNRTPSHHLLSSLNKKDKNTNKEHTDTKENTKKKKTRNNHKNTPLKPPGLNTSRCLSFTNWNTCFLLWSSRGIWVATAAQEWLKMHALLEFSGPSNRKHREQIKFWVADGKHEARNTEGVLEERALWRPPLIRVVPPPLPKKKKVTYFFFAIITFLFSCFQYFVWNFSGRECCLHENVFGRIWFFLKGAGYVFHILFFDISWCVFWKKKSF